MIDSQQRFPRLQRMRTIMMMMMMIIMASTGYSHMLLLSSPPRLPIRSAASLEISSPDRGGPSCDFSQFRGGWDPEFKYSVSG